jgi:hypothetical protein
MWIRSSSGEPYEPMRTICQDGSESRAIGSKRSDDLDDGRYPALDFAEVAAANHLTRCGPCTAARDHRFLTEVVGEIMGHRYHPSG